MLASMNEVDRIHLLIQEPPPASHDPDPTPVDDIVPTSHEHDGLGRRRRHEEAVERRQQIPVDRKPGMYYGYMSSPQSHGYMPIPQMHEFNTSLAYDPVTRTPFAPGRWDRGMLSPNIDFYEIAESSAPQIDLNTQLFDESTSHDAKQEVRKTPHRGARDRHWQCGT
ncbi:hypothetical protein RIF29_00032 [Crotalaria pallida]|uniref:Uncharacterized protein n=1 Tax=Crotalaria pallida TaxID=3830 RepID=A0AAN9P717_CROPI